MARYRAPNLPHPEGVIRCSVKHLAKRCGGVASKYRHNYTVVYPFDPPVARTARRALPYSMSMISVYGHLQAIAVLPVITTKAD